MLAFSGDSGDGVLGTLERRGKIEAFEHLIGIFESRHEQRGHFLVGDIRIRFVGQDPLAAQSLGDPDLWRALAFRDDVKIYWEDLPASEDEPCDRAVTLSYQVQVPTDRTDYNGLREDVRLDLEAIDCWVGTLVARSLRSTAARRSPAAA